MKTYNINEIIKRTFKDADIIRRQIEGIDNRCMAADGPVTPTLEEARPEELRRIYNAAKRIANRWKE